MSLTHAAVNASIAAVFTVVAAVFPMSVPVYWAVLIGLAVGAATFAGVLFSGAFDADWVSEPDPVTASVTPHASELKERLERAATNQFRFITRVQPRLCRIAHAALGQDLDTDEAREKLGPELHRLLTASDAQMPEPKTFAALMRRLEELC